MKRFALLVFATIGICIGCSSGSESSSTSGSQTPTPGVVSYSDVQAIFDKSCVKCHGTNEPKERVSLIGHEALMKGGEHGATVTPGDPENSLLIQVLRGQNGKKQMPMMSSPLPEEDIKKVEAWIKDGAKA